MMKHFLLLALASLTLLCPFWAYAQPTATDIYNKAVDWTNWVKDQKFSYTEHLIHDSDDATLLKVATEINRTIQMVQDSFGQMAQQYPEYKQELYAFKGWAAKTVLDFDYPRLQRELKNNITPTPRQLLQRLRALDAKEDEDELERLCSNIFKRFCKAHKITLVAADTVEEQQIVQINRALHWARKTDLAIRETTILMSEYTTAFNKDKPDSMAIAHKSLLEIMPNASQQVKALQPANQAEKDLLNRAIAVLTLANTFATNEMPAHIGLKKKYLSPERNNEDTDKMDRITGILSKRYVPKVNEYYEKKDLFQKERIPKPE
jgi:hypothetical protein